MMEDKRRKEKITLQAFFKGKKILVMGLGLHGGGVGVVKFLAKQGALITVTDLRSRRELKASLDALAHIKKIRYAFGKHDEDELRKADMMIKNPGVKPDAPYLRLAKERGVPVFSEIGIFFSFCPASIIGVTGTRGKSTTAWLIWKFLKNAGKRAFLGGNIRKSPLDFLEKLGKNDCVILELSSFQLFDLEQETLANKRTKKSPHIAVITNILRDHLNWHGGIKEYRSAKSVIFRFQKKHDHIFANPDDPSLQKMLRHARGHVHFSRLPAAYERIVDENLGTHYRPSIALAIAAARHEGVELQAIKKTLEKFRGLAGRQERVGTVRGVDVINDTTSTVPDATVAALKRFRPLAARRLILIAGGQDKNLDFRELAREIKKSADALVLLPGTATEKIKKILPTARYRLPTQYIQSMREAVQKAFACARKGDYVILSPGAASFGLFLNEFDRGKQFENEISKMRSRRK